MSRPSIKPRLNRNISFPQNLVSKKRTNLTPSRAPLFSHAVWSSSLLLLPVKHSALEPSILSEHFSIFPQHLGASPWEFNVSPSFLFSASLAKRLGLFWYFPQYFSVLPQSFPLLWGSDAIVSLNTFPSSWHFALVLQHIHLSSLVFQPCTSTTMSSRLWNSPLGLCSNWRYPPPSLLPIQNKMSINSLMSGH